MILELDWESFCAKIENWQTASLDFVFFISGALPDRPQEEVLHYLDQVIRVLKPGGLLFVQGTPHQLPSLGVYLDQFLTFKYWIAIESTIQYRRTGLPSKHAAVLLFTKGKSFRIKPLRFPHQTCQACGRWLKDWGGKSHLMNPEGYLVSDVWKDIPHLDNYRSLSKPIYETLLKLIPAATGEAAGILVPNTAGTLSLLPDAKTVLIEPALSSKTVKEANSFSEYQLPLFAIRANKESESESHIWNVVIQGDILETLKQYPDQSVDLVFADPPYNLNKSYNTYEDEREREDYLNWCNQWLDEYIRILKPTGSLYLLNLPRWAMYHANYLNQKLYFQNWIVWDALSEPRGKIMPAHYALLFYTRHPTRFTFNYEAVDPIDARFYCLRQSCIRARKQRGEDEKEPLTDIWWDIHRLKHRRDRDFHPCQLPDALLERIIRLSTNPGDVVVDALAGSGTTAVVAAKLGRRYVAIDLDPVYVAITKQKLAQLDTWGAVQRPKVKKIKSHYNKKALQLELQQIAHQLGHLPTPEEVQQLSRYGLEAFLETFPSWSKALKAAKLEVNHANPSS
ncbi:MAG: hypothetical protein DDG59_04725 [Anaerolineae bacterium]|jgi:site-specific DNA-methyltransferase (adenine-specific)|nr:MAG: hypothetical protein DDG59_04725 [Anaerolineae bacterium]